MRTARLDDDFDDTLYDRRYYPRKVVKDGGKINVPITLTDAAPWLQTPRRPLFDASAHQPRYAVVDRADPHVKAAEAAYAEGVRRLQDAWRTAGGGAGGAPITTAPGADTPDPDDAESPRDRYIAGLQNAYKTPMGQAPAASADNIAAISRNWLSPGARPGGSAYGDSRSRVSQETMQDARDAAETAYREYVARLVNGWRK